MGCRDCPAWAYRLGLTYQAADEETFDDDLIQLSAGYAFHFGLAVDVGYRYIEEEGAEAHTMGLLFTYAVNFAVD